MMESTSFSDFQKNLNLYFEKVNEMDKPLCVKRRKGNDIVIMNKSEYNGLQETLHLFSSPKNAERLLKSIEDDKAGRFTVRQLIE